MTNRGNELIHFAKINLLKACGHEDRRECRSLSRRCVHGRVVATCMLRPVSILSLR
jgi:hypothetical protein